MKHTLLILSLLALIPLNSADAKGKGKGKGNHMQPAIKVHASGPTISSVSANSITVDKQTYSISGKTQITVDGKKADAGALRTGMHANVTASGIDTGAAMSIEAHSGK